MPVSILCPECKTKLNTKRSKCSSCEFSYTFTDDILQVYTPTEGVTEDIKAFYEKNPFPNYDDIDSVWTLREKAKTGIFARLIDEQISTDARVLEVGCGTGQLSNFLATTGKRTIVGVDLCLNSLKLANQFKKQAKIKGVSFIQMNLFKPVFESETFDYIICSGVLHHTSDPYGGFKTIGQLVKPGGYIIIGLYNKWGRISTDIRRIIFNLTGDKFKSLDPLIRKESIGDVKKDTWFLDQYKNPHESKHTIDEVINWFGKNNFEVLNGIPKLSSRTDFSANEMLFEKYAIGNRYDHLLTQLGLLLNPGIDNGYFIVIGRKNK